MPRWKPSRRLDILSSVEVACWVGASTLSSTTYKVKSFDHNFIPPLVKMPGPSELLRNRAVTLLFGVIRATDGRGSVSAIGRNIKRRRSEATVQKHCETC